MAASIALFAGVQFGAACFAQTDARLEFDAASVKPASPGMNGYTVRFHGGPGTDDPTMFVCENMSLSNLIIIAYELNHDQLSAPGWAGGAMFNINARVPKGATHEQFQAMLRNLLADRFQLKVHRETGERASYKLVVAKNGPKFRPAPAPPKEEPNEDSPRRAAEPKPFQFDAEGYPAFGPGEEGTRMSGNRARMVDPRMTMAKLAGVIGSYVHAEVTDSTGLNGEYEISISWVVGGMHAASTGDDAEGDPGPTLFQALQQQLGLRLVESSKIPVERLVVDHAEKAPAEN